MYHALYRKYIPQKFESIPYSNNWLERSDMNEWQIVSCSKGFFSKEMNIVQNAYILKQYSTSSSLITSSVLAVEVGKKVLFFELAKDCGSFSNEMHIGDIDGDGIDEIAVHSAVGFSGGSGQYISIVLKVLDNNLIKMFEFSPKERFDTGFTCVLKDNYIISIKNSFTGYEADLDFSKDKKYYGLIYNDNGKVINNQEIFCDTFNFFRFVDIENDGIYELEGSQYISLYGHSDYIGEAKTILKFNAYQEKFEVFDALFNVNTGDGSA